ncbi:hypothetical protein [Actinomycetospora soli]|uniref:hypothetical protein n=1 Tax=Actinomycetospora soli TaxID=2893887 RepID=UPI001E641117|nr:hypothetical protein [Actinomycetospora soli]MCD2191644.1 hypothetical protein [Actinomycetospora soli]
MTSVRAKLIAAEARRVAIISDGVPADRQPTHLRDRLYALQAGDEVEVPGWLVGTALGVPVDQREGRYVITAGDNVVPAAVHEANARTAA